MRGEWLFRLLLRLHPPPFRARYGEEMIAFFREAWHEQTQGRNALGVLAFWTRTVLGTIAAAVAQRVPGAGTDGRGRDGDQGNAAPWSSDLARDIRYALRSFARQPGFAAVIAAGALGALALTRLLESLLFEMSPTDPRVFATVAAAVLGIGVAASWLPARRATAVEPAEAFRAS